MLNVKHLALFFRNFLSPELIFRGILAGNHVNCIMNRVAYIFLIVLLYQSVCLAQELNPSALVRMEHLFRDAVKEKGIRGAFLEFLADSSVVFTPKPADGKSTFAARRATPALLAWEPEFARLSLSNDLGFTTGAWSRRATPADTPSSFGTYATIWKRQADGSWKAAIDAGVEQPRAGEEWMMYVVTGPETVSAGQDWKPLSKTEQRALMEPLDLRWGNVLGAGDAQKGAPALMHSEIRVIRADLPTFAGRGAAKKYYRSRRGLREFIPAGAGVALAQDIGYTYGEYQLRSNAPSSPTAERGSYLHVWKKEKSGWMLILDLTNVGK